MTTYFDFVAISVSEKYAPCWTVSFEISKKPSITPSTVVDAAAESVFVSSFHWSIAVIAATDVADSRMALTSDSLTFDFWEADATGLIKREVTARFAYCSSIARWAQSHMAITNTIVDTPMIMPRELRNARSRFVYIDRRDIRKICHIRRRN